MENTATNNETTVNEKENKVMNENKVKNGVTETQVAMKVDILDRGVFIKPTAGKQINGMTADAYIEEIINQLNDKSQVWAYADDNLIAITSDSRKCPDFNTKLKQMRSNANCQRVEGDEELCKLKNKLSAIAKAVRVEEAVYQIEKLGGKFDKGSCILASSGKCKLILTMFIDKEKGSRYYQITEEMNGKIWGNQCNENRFRPDAIKDASKISGFLVNRLGDYSESESAIAKICCLIETFRLILIDEDRIINAEILDIADVFKGFENYIKHHITDEGIIAVKLSTGEIHVGIGASPSKQASKIFDTILDYIAPANSSRAVKSELKREGKLKTDKADYQKTLSDRSCQIGDKIYSFNFDEKVLVELYELYLTKHKSDESLSA